jgi:hypothetical protein
MVRLRFILPMPIWSPPTPNCCVSCCARVREPPFNGVIGYDALRSLKRELRMYFVQFCHKTPALTAEVFAACQKTGFAWPRDGQRHIQEQRPIGDSRT